MSTTYIDDQDLTKVTYNGTWAQGGSPGDYKETVASSTHVGDSFTIDFKGTSITVFGTIDAASEGVVTTYSVDGASPANVTAPAVLSDTPQQQFWKSPALSLGQHKLLVTVGKVNDVIDPDSPGEGTVWFDYFLTFDPSIVSPTSSRTSNHAAVGAIIGGVIGGLLFAIIVTVIIYLKRRHRHRKIQSSEGNVASNSSIGTRMANIHSFPLHPFTLGPRNTTAARRNKNAQDAVIHVLSSVINPRTPLGTKNHSSRVLNRDNREVSRFPIAGPGTSWEPPPLGGEANSQPQSVPPNTIDAPTVDMPPAYTDVMGVSV
ncbi:hypothetical protein BD779DRAFT_1560127 [Infundibulicybe gibba]|nr:hypothetical protein BD779DRAFT_1560127 [Infundibulicybe gibba]